MFHPRVAPGFFLIRGLARSSGGCLSVGWRRSIRSFSKFAAVCVFSSESSARSFSRRAALIFGIEFCAVRRGRVVSVPCVMRGVFRRPFRGRRAIARLFLVSLFVSNCLRFGVRLRRRPLVVDLVVFPAADLVAADQPSSSLAADRIVASASAIGFSGSRSLAGSAAASLGRLAGLVSPAASVFVGCAEGADRVVRDRLGDRCSVFSVASGEFGSGREAFARRSSALVRSVVEAGGGSGSGLWISFPGVRPLLSGGADFVPCRSWRSAGGSGSWGSLALAAGSGLACLVYSASVPAWGFESVGLNWWYLPPSGGASGQLSLF